MGWGAIEAVDDIFRAILQNTFAPIDRKCDNSPMFYDQDCNLLLYGTSVVNTAVHCHLSYSEKT